MGVSAPESGIWVQLPATIVIYLGIMLILCSRNLRSRASIVCWEGILRIAIFFLLIGYVIFGELAISMALIGAVDLFIGLIYIIGLFRSLEVKAAQLLADGT